jgi:hypothetical protein
MLPSIFSCNWLPASKNSAFLLISRARLLNSIRRPNEIRLMTNVTAGIAFERTITTLS